MLIEKACSNQNEMSCCAVLSCAQFKKKQQKTTTRYCCLHRRRQLKRQSYTVAQDRLLFPLLKECGHIVTTSKCGLSNRVWITSSIRCGSFPRVVNADHFWSNHTGQIKKPGGIRAKVRTELMCGVWLFLFPSFLHCLIWTAPLLFLPCLLSLGLTEIVNSDPGPTLSLFSYSVFPG